MSRFLGGSFLGGQDPGGTKFVQQIGWENDKHYPKMQNWKIGSQVAKIGKKYKRNYNDWQGLLPDTTWSASGRYLRGCQRMTLKVLDYHGIILRLTWARVDHTGLHFRVGHTLTFLENGLIANREALAPLVQGFWWVFTLDN